MKNISCIKWKNFSFSRKVRKWMICNTSLSIMFSACPNKHSKSMGQSILHYMTCNKLNFSASTAWVDVLCQKDL